MVYDYRIKRVSFSAGCLVRHYDCTNTMDGLFQLLLNNVWSERNICHFLANFVTWPDPTCPIKFYKFRDPTRPNPDLRVNPTRVQLWAESVGYCCQLSLIDVTGPGCTADAADADAVEELGGGVDVYA